jgi:hypothetical protein
MGRFKYLLFVAICFVLLGIERKAHASVTPASDTMSGVPTGVIGSPGNSLASNAFTAHPSDHSLMTRYTVLPDAGSVVATGDGSPIAASNVTTRKSGTFAVRARNATANLASGSASNVVTSASSGPLILYTDITSGPNSGGESNNGTYLTIFGSHFGATRGTSTLTINGRAVAQYIIWSDTKIGVQVGHVSSGPIVVSAGGLVSNSDKTFTVRSGHIYYIGPSVDNSAPGSCPAMISRNSYSTPWGLTNYASTTESNYNPSKMRTPYTYYNCMSPGDTLVFLNGVSYPYFDGRGWHSSLTPDNASVTSKSFMTIMARPGATATLGGEGWAQCGIRNTGASTYTVYSGLTLIGSGPNGGGLNADQYDRFVGNTVKCPDCSGPAGALTGGSYNEALGNRIYDISTDTAKLPNGSNKTYHDVYFSGNNFEFAWNRIYNTAAYNGFQIHHDGSSGFYNFSIHDNDIADVNGSGINLSTIDPSSGYIRVFNNVIHHVGMNSASDGGGGDPHSCIAVKGYGRATVAGTVEIYNNTMYDCNSYLNLNPSSNASCAILVFANQLNVTTHLVNNIVYQPAYVGTARQNVYICGGGSIGTTSGSNNLWYSERAPRSTAPATQYGTIANPRFISATNYHLQSGSPAIGAGIAIGGLTRDFDGTLWPKLPAIGAYEYSKSNSAATASLVGVAATPNAIGPFSARKRIIFLSIALASLILIGVGWNCQQG